MLSTGDVCHPPGTIGYAYDADNQLLSKTAPAPNQTGAATATTNYSYDAVHRLTAKTYTGGASTPAVKYGYDGNALTGCTTTPPTLSPADQNPINSRTSMCDGSGATAWSHDAMGRVLSDKRTIVGSSSITNAFTYAYNFNGSAKTLAYPSGRTITYSVDASGSYTSGRLAAAQDFANSINYVTTTSYTPFGAVAQYAMGGTIQGVFTYNSRLQPLQMFYGTNTPTAGSLQSLTCPTNVGNLLHRVYVFGLGTNDNGTVQSITNCRDTNRTQNFGYDSLNRITQAYTNGSAPLTTSWGEAFTIDAWGNLTNKGSIANKTNTETLNAAPATNKNQLNGFCNDSAGNHVLNAPCPTGTFTPTYSYDDENRLTSTAGWTYVYDGDSGRVKKSNSASNGTLYWTGSGSSPLLESSLSGTGTGEYINDYVVDLGLLSQQGISVFAVGVIAGR